MQLYGHALAGEISESAAVAAVNPGRRAATCRAEGLDGGRAQLDEDRHGGTVHAIDGQIGSRERENVSGHGGWYAEGARRPRL